MLQCYTFCYDVLKVYKKTDAILVIPNLYA